MWKWLDRLWAGIVGSVTGACLGLVLAIILLMMGVSLEFGLWSIAALALICGTAGCLMGNRKLPG